MQKKVVVPVESEGFQLEGCVHGTSSSLGAIVCHPSPDFGGDMNNAVVLALTLGLVGAEHCVLRFNFRSVGRSGGKPGHGYTEHRDVGVAVSFFKQQFIKQGSVALIGYSFGALMAARAIAEGLCDKLNYFVAVGLPTRMFETDSILLALLQQVSKTVACLFIVGDQDEYCDTNQLERLTLGIPNVNIQVLRGVNHFPTRVDLELIVKKTVAFVNQTHSSNL